MAVETAVDYIPVVDGHLTAPDLPGLGIEPNMDVLGEPVATYEYRGLGNLEYWLIEKLAN